jgi:hypothetical protein
MRGTRILGVALLAWLVTGCAVGNRYAYHTVIAEPRLEGAGSVGVGTHDQRDDVRKGEKDPQFVGLQRGGYGNPFDVRTQGDRPLADDMTTSLVNTLSKRGFRVQAVIIAHTVPPDQARERVVRVGGDRAVLLTVKEWKSDAMARLGLSYDVTMLVLDRAGTVLAEKRIHGDKEVLGAAGLQGANSEAVGRAFKAKLETLLDDPAITAALRGGS